MGSVEGVVVDMGQGSRWVFTLMGAVWWEQYGGSCTVGHSWLETGLSGERFEGLSRGMRGDSLRCKGAPLNA